MVGLDFGTWTLTETQAPTGYTAAPSRDVVITPGSPTASFGAVVNHEDGRIAWTKVGEDGTPIAGAGFTLTTPGQSVVVDDYTGQHDYTGATSTPTRVSSPSTASTSEPGRWRRPRCRPGMPGARR